MTKLSWNDLLIDTITPEQFQSWLSPWAGVVSGKMAPAFMTRFGDWFLHRPEGHIDRFSVITGQCVRVADSHADLVSLINTREGQDALLLANLVSELHDAGKVPGSDQCYALAPHPALGGPNPYTGGTVNTRYVTITDVIVWQSICAQTLARPATRAPTPKAVEVAKRSGWGFGRG
jgi:hypothetical protein